MRTRRRSRKGADGETRFEPCSPSEPGAVEATLTQLAEKGLAPQVRATVALLDYGRMHSRTLPSAGPCYTGPLQTGAGGSPVWTGKAAAQACVGFLLCKELRC